MTHGFSWHRTTYFVVLLGAALAAWWDFLFWGHPVGVSAALFALAVALALMARSPALWKRAQGRLIAALALVAVAALAEEPARLAALMVLVTMGTLVLIGQRDLDLWRDSAPAWFAKWVALGALIWVRWIRDNVLVGRWLVRHPHMDGRVFRVVRAMGWWVLPVLAGALFAGLFAFANPVIGRFFEHVWEMVNQFFVWLMELSFLRMGMWIVVMVGIYGLMRHRHCWRPGVKVPPVVARGSGRERLTGVPMIVRLLVVMNLVFAIENVLDAAYLYVGVALPEGLSYKEYNHRGAYTLIATALLAGMFTLVAFRAGGAAQRSRACRWMVYAWIGQNILLLVSTVWRVWVYVDTTELTRLRVGTMIWCGVVAAGFMWIILRIMRGRTNAWLWRMNAFTALGVLLACGFINFDGMIGDFNVRHCAESGGGGGRLDIAYLEHLGTPTLPAVRWMREHPGALDADRRERMAKLEKKFKGELEVELRDWRGWTWRRRRAAGG